MCTMWYGQRGSEQERETSECRMSTQMRVVFIDFFSFLLQFKLLRVIQKIIDEQNVCLRTRTPWRGEHARNSEGWAVVEWCDGDDSNDGCCCCCCCCCSALLVPSECVERCRLSVHVGEYVCMPLRQFERFGLKPR